MATNKDLECGGLLVLGILGQSTLGKITKAGINIIGEAKAGAKAARTAKRARTARQVARTLEEEEAAGEEGAALADDAAAEAVAGPEAWPGAVATLALASIVWMSANLWSQNISFEPIMKGMECLINNKVQKIERSKCIAGWAPNQDSKCEPCRQIKGMKDYNTGWGVVKTDGETPPQLGGQS